MTVIEQYYMQAELSLAAYADLSGPISDHPVKLREAGMSEKQAQIFAERWRVVDQYTHTEQTPIYDDGGNITGYLTTSNGLTVTVFQEVATGKRYLEH
ncbi:MAG: hypothetical protein IPO57_08555 [Rhodocyclales bacterium]|jgi:hypothetical protein|nr:hypothetical protein [Rhodocyclales bacterium]